MKPTKTYSDAKQTMWETWFNTSFILFMCVFFIGTLDNSQILIPWWPYAFVATGFNLAMCLYIGVRTTKE